MTKSNEEIFASCLGQAREVVRAMATNPEIGFLGLRVQGEKHLQNPMELHKCIISQSRVNKTVTIQCSLIK